MHKGNAFWIIPTHRLLVSLVRGTSICRRVQSIGGMILTEDNRSTRIKTWHCAAFSIKRLTTTGPGLKPGLRSDRAATFDVRYGTYFEV
jgi:hypothetical protein